MLADEVVCYVGALGLPSSLRQSLVPRHERGAELLNSPDCSLTQSVQSSGISVHILPLLGSLGKDIMQCFTMVSEIDS